MVEEVVINVVADLIVALLFLLLAIGTYIVFYFTDRRRLLRFFGISNELPRLRIYVSRMEIRRGGSRGFKPIAEGYSGPAISKIEYEAALLVRDLLQSRFLAFSPKRLQGWLRQQYFTFISVDPQIHIAPKGLKTVTFDNMILLGSSAYNLISNYYLEEHQSGHFCFVKAIHGEHEEHALKIRAGGLNGIQVPGRSYEQELGIIQRINDSDHGNTVFICAGLGSTATYGSARYLVDNWRNLQSQYNDEEFAICLAFPAQPPDSETSDVVVNPIVIYEFIADRCRLHQWSVTQDLLSDEQN